MIAPGGGDTAKRARCQRQSRAAYCSPVQPRTRAPLPSPQASRRGGPVHIREVVQDALERVSARQLADAPAGPDRPALIRLPTFSNAA